MNPLTPTAIDPTIFFADATGAFTTAGQHFAYDTANGHLFYSATGLVLLHQAVGGRPRRGATASELRPLICSGAQ